MITQNLQGNVREILSKPLNVVHNKQLFKNTKISSQLKQELMRSWGLMDYMKRLSDFHENKRLRGHINNEIMRI